MTRKKKAFAYNIIVGILLLGSIIWVCSRFIHLGNIEYTENAQVKQLIVPVNYRVSGFISKIYFSEYQTVKKGDTLAIIEDTEFRYRLAQAEADFQNSLSDRTSMNTSIITTHNNISVSDAGIS